MSFYVGQKVVCVNNGEIYGIAAPQLSEGTVYTVTAARILRGFPGITVAEVQAADGYWGFLTQRFRPAVERKTDISIFQRMLTDDLVSA